MDKKSSKIFEFVKFKRRTDLKRENDSLSEISDLSEKSEKSEKSDKSDKSDLSDCKIIKVARFTSPSSSVCESPLSFSPKIQYHDIDIIEEEEEEIEYNIAFQKLEDTDYDKLQLTGNCENRVLSDSFKKKKNFFSQIKQSIKEEEEEVNVEKVISQCCENKDEVELFLDSVMKINFNEYFVDVIKKDLLNHIEFLYMSKNDLNYIDKSIFCLKQIVELDLSSNKLKKLPEDIGNLKNLVKINLSYNHLADLPYNFENLGNLEILNLESNDFRQIPPVIFKINKLKNLYLANNSEITTFPPKKFFSSFEEIRIWIDNVPELVSEVKTMQLPPNIKFEFNKIYPDKILENLFLGDIKSTFNKYVYDYYNITNVFSIGRELEVQNFDGINYEQINIDDDDNQSVDFKIVDKIHNKILNKKKCLVHCQKGMSRSVTVVLAYLMKYKNMRLYDAYVFVKDKRNQIYPNGGFWKQLIKYDEQLFGKEERNLDEIRK